MPNARVSAGVLLASLVALGVVLTVTARADDEGKDPVALPSGITRKGVEDGHTIYIHDTGKGVKVEMVWVPPGDFTMGSDDDDRPDWGPKHTHRIEKGFFIGRYETTWRDYRAFCTATKRTPPDAPKGGGTDSHPAVDMSWEDAKAFCDWAGLVLPTEAEWEKAARGTDGRKYPHGNSAPTAEQYVHDAHPKFGGKSAAPVGSGSTGVSPYGAHDMAGNVWELCGDWWDGVIYERYAKGDRTPPATGDFHNMRGGSWQFDATYLLCAYRGRAADRGNRTQGFRPARRS